MKNVIYNPNIFGWEFGDSISEEEYQIKTIDVFDKGIINKILLPSLMYVEGEDGYSIFHLDNLTVVIGSYNLNHYSALLPENYCGRTCKGYIINFSHIKDITTNATSAKMTDKEFIPVSKKVRAQFKEEYLSFGKKKGKK